MFDKPFKVAPLFDFADVPSLIIAGREGKILFRKEEYNPKYDFRTILQVIKYALFR